MPTKKTKPASSFTLTLDKRAGKILLNMLGAIELRMFEKGFQPAESQLKTVAALRAELSRQIHGSPDASLEDQLAAAVEWGRKKS